MSRSMWFVAGAGVGVYAVVRARRVAESLTPEGLGDRLAGLRLGAQMFGEEVRLGMTERETQLRLRLGLGRDGPPGLNPALQEPPGPDQDPAPDPDKDSA
ncbi:MAG: DUF6167 family protein [Actinomycetota bacterium]|nr:DUF6167 family protein [Actinomycetota bacterium]